MLGPLRQRRIEKDEDLADELHRMATEAVEGMGGSVLKEISFDLKTDEEIRAARIPEKRGVAVLRGRTVTIGVDTRPPWLRQL